MSFEGSTYTWWHAGIGIAIVLAAFFVGRLFAGLFSRGLTHLVRRSATQADDLLVEVLAKNLPWWIAAAVAFAVVRFGPAPAPPGVIAIVDKSVRVVVSLTITFAVASILAGLLERRVLPLGQGVGVTTLGRKFVWWVVLAVGGTMTLSGLGVEITPLLTALGIGSLALGLALQPTLSNIFAGANLSMARRIRVGDFVRLEGGQEGRIVDIGWRATEIHSIADSTVLVPNAKLAEIIVTNFSLPADEVTLNFELTVPFSADLERVERVLIDEARALQKSEDGAVKDHEPFVRFLGFTESAIRLHVVLRARTFPDRMLLAHQFLKRSKARLQLEGIELPYPQRIVRTIGTPQPSSIDAL